MQKMLTKLRNAGPLLLPSYKKSIGNKFGAKLMQISTVWSMDLLIRKNFEQFDCCFSEYVKDLIIFKC